MAEAYFCFAQSLAQGFAQNVALLRSTS
jgi:hypothetical protein